LTVRLRADSNLPVAWFSAARPSTSDFSDHSLKGFLFRGEAWASALPSPFVVSIVPLPRITQKAFLISSKLVRLQKISGNKFISRRENFIPGPSSAFEDAFGASAPSGLGPPLFVSRGFVPPKALDAAGACLDFFSTRSQEWFGTPHCRDPFGLAASSLSMASADRFRRPRVRVSWTLVRCVPPRSFVSV